jgi:6-phosphogluconolactonase
MQRADGRVAARWTRREFVRGVAGVVALPALQSGVAGRQFAYVASGQGWLDVFRVSGKKWTRMQRVPSRAPASILLSAAQTTLYVANDVDVHENLPRGSVEAFHVDAFSGQLTLLNRQPLSLSATHPRHMALSPDGGLLAIAAYGGAIYNTLAIAEDGRLGPASGIFKQAGCGLHPTSQGSAHPHTILFDGSGRHLLSSDFGSDRLSVFAVEEGRLQRPRQRTTGDGSGPGACVLHPGLSVFYAWHELESTLACYRYDEAPGTMGEAIQRLPMRRAAMHALGLHPTGRMLYTAQANPNELRAWRVDGEGRLSDARLVPLGEATATRITVAANGESVFLLDQQRGSVHTMTADPASGELHGRAEVARVNEPTSIAVKTM